VRASAGTGKTFRISSRIVGLLAHGARPDEILASTFTRKAAGEILDRVLLRLARAALDDEAAEELAAHAAFESDADALIDRQDALDLLERLVRDLHRADVGTLDALFVRMARSYCLELGLPPVWTIADQPTAERLRSEAIQDVLARGDAGTLVELVRASSRGETTRRVHDRLVDQVDELHGVFRQLDIAADAPWSPFREAPSIDDPAAERRSLAARIARVDPPRNKDGSSDSRWRDALAATAGDVEDGRWESLWSGGLGGKHLSGERTYYSKPFPGELVTLLERTRQLAAAELAGAYDRQAGALGRLAERYDEALLDRLGDAGAYRFEDVTHLLGRGAEPVAGRDDLTHRLDRRSQHVLLDEFQDTSPPQWEAIRPLVDRVAGGRDPSRAMVVVADPKQSIYGWRGADPELVGRVGRRYDLEEDRLYRSYRSSPVVLEFVNRLFGNLASSPVLAEVDLGPEVAAAWSTSFDEHRPAAPVRDAPGHVLVEVGPRDEGRGSDRPRLMARAAQRVAELRAAAPEATIGVLTRTNRAVARLIHELRLRGVEASEEGGTPVDDAAPVAAVLALLRMADHPGDRVARYHVASTPLGEVVGFRDIDDDPAARRLATRVRRSLIRDGYGPVLSGWAKQVADHVDPGELRRLEQLIELGFRWEERAGLRPSDFVRFAESQRMTDPLETPVRVMTVHRAKGLEFDVVVLPDLDSSLTGGGRGGSAALPERDPRTGRVRRVFPYVRKNLRPLFPEIEEAVRQDAAARLRDEISWLYVAVTRARHALHLIVAADDPERGPGSAKSFARLVRSTLEETVDAAADGDVLWERGRSDWHERRARQRRVEEHGEPGDRLASEPGDVTAGSAELELRVDPSLPRTRIFGRRTPSDLEGGDTVDVGRLLDLERGAALRRGDVVHRWASRIAWIEDDDPADEELLRLARRTAASRTPEPELRDLLASFRGWLSVASVRGILSRERTRARLDTATRAEEGVTLDVHTERPFALRMGDELMTGSVDRLVLVRSTRGVLGAEIVDFKTDDVPGDASGPLADRVETYRPQLEAYRRAVARQFGVSEETVDARLVFLQPGVVREI
jgi:ATP-dependent exoDNAse (exonuclease V) beta subunit